MAKTPSEDKSLQQPLPLTGIDLDQFREACEAQFIALKRAVAAVGGSHKAQAAVDDEELWVNSMDAIRALGRRITDMSDILLELWKHQHARQAS